MGKLKWETNESESVWPNLEVCFVAGYSMLLLFFFPLFHRRSRKERSAQANIIKHMLLLLTFHFRQRKTNLHNCEPGTTLSSQVFLKTASWSGTRYVWAVSKHKNEQQSNTEGFPQDWEKEIHWEKYSQQLQHLWEGGAQRFHTALKCFDKFFKMQLSVIILWLSLAMAVFVYVYVS